MRRSRTSLVASERLVLARVRSCIDPSDPQRGRSGTWVAGQSPMVSTVRELNERGVVRVPRHMRAQTMGISTWRWLATIAVVFAVVHDRTTPDTAIADRLASHGAALLPIGAMFSIGPIMLVALLCYALFQLFEEERHVEVHDLISRHVVTYSLLSVLAITTLEHDNLYITAAILAASALIAGSAYVRVQVEIAEGRAMRWFGIPFATALGFSATLAIAALEAVASSWVDTGSAAAIGACAGLSTLAIGLCLRYREAVLAGLIGWGLIAICAANRATTELAGIALLGGTACAASAIVVAFTRWSTPQPAARGRHARR